MSYARFKNFIFDFDGTLFDTKEGIIACAHYTFKKLNLSQIPDKQITEATGPPLDTFLARVLNREDDKLVKKAINIYKKKYDSFALKKSTPYPGMVDLIKFLTSVNFKLYVVTNKRYLITYKLLKKFSLIDHFQKIRAWHPGIKMDQSKDIMIKKLISDEKLEKDKTCIIGDKREDIIAGKRNNIFTVGAGYGYGSRDELRLARPDRIIYNIKSLKSLFT